MAVRCMRWSFYTRWICLFFISDLKETNIYISRHGPQSRWIIIKPAINQCRNSVKKGKTPGQWVHIYKKNISWLFSSKNGVGEVGSSRVEIIVPRRCTATSPSHFWLVQEFRYISSATILVASLVSEVKTSTLSNWIAHELKKHQSTVSNGPSHLAFVYIKGAKRGEVPSRGRFV